MFDRITISHVPASRTVRIAFTMLKPVGWKTLDTEDEWLAFGPPWKRDAGFLVIMQHSGLKGPEQLLTSSDGLIDYVGKVCPQMTPYHVEDDDNDNDDFCPYDLLYFHGRIEGIAGRLIAGGTAIEIEDVNFALIGFARDEVFHLMQNTFRSMVCSFQPMVFPL